MINSQLGKLANLMFLLGKYQNVEFSEFFTQDGVIYFWVQNTTNFNREYCRIYTDDSITIVDSAWSDSVTEIIELLVTQLELV